MKIIGIITTTVLLIVIGNILEHYFGSNLLWNFDLFAGIIIGWIWFYYAPKQP